MAPWKPSDEMAHIASMLDIKLNFWFYWEQIIGYIQEHSIKMFVIKYLIVVDFREDKTRETDTGNFDQPV